MTARRLQQQKYEQDRQHDGDEGDSLDQPFHYGVMPFRRAPHRAKLVQRKTRRPREGAGGVETDIGPVERSDAGDVGGEEVDAVAIEVASGAVVVLGGTWVGVAGQDLGVP